MKATKAVSCLIKSCLLECNKGFRTIAILILSTPERNALEEINCFQLQINRFV